MNRKVVISCITLAVVLGGCNLFQKKNDVDRVDPGVLEGTKTKLLQDIDHKYENPEAHYQLGKIYHSEGLYNRAEWEYNVALQFDPVLYRAQAAKVKLYQDMGQGDRCRLAADLYMNQAAVSAEASSLLGKAFQAEQMDEYAIACYQQALTKAPDSAALHKQIGYYYLAKGDNLMAEEYLRRSVQLDPYQPEVAEQLGRMGVAIQVPRKKESGKAVDKAMNEQ